MADYGLLGGLAEGLKQGLGSYREERGRQDQLSREEADRQLRRQLAEQQLEQQGLLQKQRNQEFQAQQSDRDRRFGLDERRLSLEEKRLNQKGTLDPVDRLIQIQTAKDELAKRKASVPGFDIAEGAVPGIQDAQKIKTQASAVNNVKSLVSELREINKQAGGAKIMPGPLKTRYNQAYGNLKVALKNAAELGALTGPDVALLEETVPNPTSLKTMFFHNEKELDDAFANVQKAAEKGLLGAAEARGYLAQEVPSEQQDMPPGADQTATASQMSPEDQQALQWAQSNPNDPRAKEIRKRLGVQ